MLPVGSNVNVRVAPACAVMLAMRLPAVEYVGVGAAPDRLRGAVPHRVVAVGVRDRRVRRVGDEADPARRVVADREGLREQAVARGGSVVRNLISNHEVTIYEVQRLAFQTIVPEVIDVELNAIQANNLIRWHLRFKMIANRPACISAHFDALIRGEMLANLLLRQAALQNLFPDLAFGIQVCSPRNRRDSTI